MAADPMFLQNMRKTLKKRLSEFDNTDDLLQEMREFLAYPEFAQEVQNSIDHFTREAAVLKDKLLESRREEYMRRDGTVKVQDFDDNVNEYLDGIMELNERMEHALTYYDNRVQAQAQAQAQAEAQAAADAREAYFLNIDNYFNPNYARGGYTAKSNLMKQGVSRKFGKKF